MHIATGEDGRGRTKMSGEVLDYTGRELKLKLSGGAEKLIPAERVVAVDTTHSAEERAADADFAVGKFAEAAALYEKAFNAEDRTWVRRQIIAQLVWSLRSAGNDGAAGEKFLLLVRSDPATRFFDSIPLAWLPGAPPPELEQKARRWLDQDALPAAVLLGASHLLLAGPGSAAASKLSQLTDNPDPRIAALARAQLWRKQITTAGGRQLDEWSAAIDRTPQPLRAGPYFVLGRGLAQQKEHEAAALALLRVPILYPRERALASRSLEEAGRSLEKIDQRAEAARLSQEIVSHHPADSSIVDASDERFLAGLRQRQLFRLAETYCRERLSDPKLPTERQAELVIELSRALLEHAWQSAPDEADPLWQRALDAPAGFARDNPTVPQSLLARVQAALVLLARGEHSRQRWEIMGDDQAALAEIRGYLRTAGRELIACQEIAAERLRAQGNSTKLKPGELTRGQLLSLQNNIRYQLARAYRNQALCYPADSPDRHNALAQAIETLTPLTELDATDPLCWPSQLEVAACFRLSRDYDEAAQRLATLAKADPPAGTARLAQAERIHLLLDQQRTVDALRLTDSISAADLAGAPELAYAVLAAYLSAWRTAEQAKDQTRAQQWEERAAAAVEQMQRDHPPYWTRRAESLLAATVARGQQTGNLTVLVRAAEAEYRAGRLDAALATYDRARRQAADKQNSEQAFQLGYTAAAIEHERKHHAQAAERYRQLALGTPSHADAPQAHLLAVFNASQAARPPADGSAADPAALDHYIALLDEHLQRWPDSSTASQARWLRGRLEEHRGAWSAAIDSYQRVATDHEQFGPAVEAVARCYDKWLGQLRADRKSTAEIAPLGARWFEGILTATDNRLPERWSAIDRTAALAAARLWMAVDERSVERAERILTAALRGTEDDTSDGTVAWRATARCLLVSALARLGRTADARRTLDELEEVEPAAAQVLLEDISALVASLPAKQRKELADLQGRVARLAGGRDGQLPESAQRAIDLAQARSLSGAGRTAEAIEAFAVLAKKYPREGQVQEEYAQALSAAKDRQTLELAVEKWHEVETKSRPGGERWFRARYQLAVALYRLGEKERASTIVTSTRALYPNLGGGDVQEKFLALLNRLEK